MSNYQNFCYDLVSKLKVNVSKDINEKINNKCTSSTLASQVKTAAFNNVISHFLPPYDNIDIDCSNDTRVCKGIIFPGSNQPFDMVCSVDTKKCIPACTFELSQLQNVGVNINCIGETSSFVQGTSTEETTSEETVKISVPNIEIQQSTYNQLSGLIDSLYPQQNTPSLVQAINEVFIKTISNKNMSQTCSTSILVRQNQDIIIQGDIYCDPYSSIVISQKTNINNYINCIFSTALSTLLMDPAAMEAYNNSLSADCICDKKLLGNCDKIAKQRPVQFSILKPAKGTGSCDCPVNAAYESCNPVDPKAPVCLVSEWSNWTECKEGTQRRTRELIAGSTNCPKLEEIIECGNSTVFKSSQVFQEIKNISKAYWYIIILFVLFFIWANWIRKKVSG
jgi:hypothetical protein